VQTHPKLFLGGLGLVALGGAFWWRWGSWWLVLRRGAHRGDAAAPA